MAGVTNRFVHHGVQPQFAAMPLLAQEVLPPEPGRHLPIDELGRQDGDRWFGKRRPLARLEHRAAPCLASRVYRDALFDRLVRCPHCRGAGSAGGSRAHHAQGAAA